MDRAGDTDSIEYMDQQLIPMIDTTRSIAMNLTKLFIFTLTVTFAATSIAFAGQSQIKSKPQQKAKAHKPSEKQTKPAKSDRSRTAYDPVLAAEQAKGSEPYRKSMETVNQLLRKAESCYKADKIGETERLVHETIASSVALSRLFLSTVRSGATSEFSGQMRSSQVDARRLIGKIRMKQQFYDEALEWFRADWREGEDKQLDLDIALCFVRLGNDDAARRFYSDSPILRYASDLTAKDLPGTRTPKTLEASILFARGMQVYLTSRPKEALEDFAAASKLVPNNGVFAFFVGRSSPRIKRHSEALVYYRTAIRCLRFKSTFMESAKESEQGMIYYKRIGL